MKKIILLILMVFIISSCGLEKKSVDNNTLNNIKEQKIKISFSNPKNDLEKEINNVELNFINNYINKLKLAQLYLKYGSAYFKEDIFTQKALKLLNSINSDSKVDYLKGYAYEIQTKYNDALKQYKKVLSYKQLDKKEKVNVINQIGHIYDLQGYTEKANKEYLKAEKINPEDIKTMLNRGRYEIRNYNYENSEKYFKKVLEKTNDKYLKAELYYDLSIIYQDDYKLEKAIKYAKMGIKENKDYPNNYLSIGVSFILKNGKDIDKAPEYLKKSIELYKNNSIGYKYLGIYYYKKDDFNKAIENFKKQVELSQKDILLMQNDKEKTKIAGEYDLARTYALEGDVDNSIKYLKKVLNGENDLYYEWFLIDFVKNDGDFKKIINDNVFKTELKNILLKYNKKKNEKIN